jgi:mannosyltransferase
VLIFDNIIFELQVAGGISVYWSELLCRAKKDNASMFFGRKNNNIFSPALEGSVVYDEAYPRLLSRRYLPFSPADKGLVREKHIFHSSYLRYSNHPSSINVTTVHDFTYERFVRGPKLWVHNWQKKLAVRKSHGIICVSENTKNDLLKFFPWVNPNLIKVIYNGVGEEFFPVDNPFCALFKTLRFRSEAPYLLFVGDRSSYKNFDAFLDLAEYLPHFEFVIVGGKPLEKEEIQRSRKFGDRIHHFRGVSSAILNLLYNGAFCLVYPSSYEGFGIPILEAMKAGCPVVSSNLSSIPEIAGQAALLVDNPTPGNLATEVLKLEDAGVRLSLREKGFEQAARFSWDKCYQDTQKFYQELWNKEQ